MVVDGVAGVEVQTEKVWSFADEFKLPRAIVINKLDRERSSFERTLESVQAVFGRTAIPIQLPIGAEKRFQRRRRSGPHEGLHLHARWRRQGQRRRDPRRPGRGRHRRRTKLWSRWWPKATTRCWKNSSTKGTLPVEHIIDGLREAVRERRIFPVLCASALHNIGTDLLLNFIVENFPGARRARPVERQR